VIFISGILYYNLAIMINSNIIYLEIKKENPSFFVRKKDEIIINIISLILGGVIGYVLRLIQ
jgi:hypothetical protein